MKKEYVICTKCGKHDKPDKTIVPHNPGTCTKMECLDCINLCRDCCPTGHGTHFIGEKW